LYEYINDHFRFSFYRYMKALCASNSLVPFYIHEQSRTYTFIVDILWIIKLIDFTNSFLCWQIHTSFFFSLCYATASHNFLCLSWSRSSVNYSRKGIRIYYFIKDENVVLFNNLIFISFHSFFKTL
jgi:hypothetical protein